MTYQDAIKFLNNNHFYPNITTDLETDEIVNLWIEEPPALAKEKIERLKEVLKGKPFEVGYVKSLKQIHITMNK